MSNYNKRLRDNDIFGTEPLQTDNGRKAHYNNRRDNDIFGTGPVQDDSARHAHFNNRKDNDIFGTGPVQDNSSHRVQLQNRNASSFNIIGFDPNPQSSQKENDQLRKVEKQNQYRDQLNQMVYDKNERRHAGEDSRPSTQYSQGRDNEYYHGGNDYESQYSGGSYQQQQDYRQQVEDDQDKKKRLQMEMLKANQQAAQNKQAWKKRQSAMEAEEDNRRIHDSVKQFERDVYQQQAAKKNLQEENTRQLNQQRSDYRKTIHDYDNLSSNMDHMDLEGPLRDRPQSRPDSQYSQNQGYNAQNDYQRNRDRNRYGNNFNIISNENN